MRGRTVSRGPTHTPPPPQLLLACRQAHPTQTSVLLLPLSETETPPISQSPVEAPPPPPPPTSLPARPARPGDRARGPLSAHCFQPCLALSLTATASCVRITDFFTSYRPPPTPTASHFPEPPGFGPMADPFFSSGVFGSEVPPASSGVSHLSGHNRLQVSSRPLPTQPCRAHLPGSCAWSTERDPISAL